MDQKIKIKIIIGSTREGRFGERPARWIYDELKGRDDVEVEVLDLRDYPMPFFNNPISPSRANRKYPDEVTRKWSAKIDEADAFIITVAEYNHGYTAVLKNALDSIFPEWNRKAVGFVSYGSVGGARAVEQLREVSVELKLVSIAKSLHIPFDVVMKAWAEKPPSNAELFGYMRNMNGTDHLDLFVKELLWIAGPLKSAREADAKK